MPLSGCLKTISRTFVYYLLQYLWSNYDSLIKPRYCRQQTSVMTL